MHWLDGNSALAVKLRRLRGRFGIAAPRVTIRTHVPWYWRALAIALTGGAAIAVAGWIYDAGRRIAGFDSSETAQAIETLTAQVAELQAEVNKLRAANDASESSLQIERTAQQQLSAQVQALEADNNRLKEENAVFERLAQGGGKDSSVTISRLRVFPDGAGGRYRYQFLVSQNGDQRGREFKGSVQVVATLPGGSPNGMMTFPRPNDPEAGRYAVVFKHFRSIDGAFTIPGDQKPKSVEIRLVQDGAVRAAQTVSF
jgi:predicted phage gp36 major capsid-like protein